MDAHIDDETPSPEAIEVEATIKKIKPFLAGKAPDIQGAILADLLALWLAGHPPFIREEMLAHHMHMVRALAEVNEFILFGPNGHPQKD